MLRPRLLAFACACALAGCTFGAPAATSGPGTAGAQSIAVNLTTFMDGYAPDVLTIAAGTRVQFVNTDSFAHTATSIAGSAFPGASPFDGNALTASGVNLSSPWSSGAMQAGATSQSFIADAPGMYLFGCFFHYGHPMRGTIVVR